MTDPINPWKDGSTVPEGMDYCELCYRFVDEVEPVQQGETVLVCAECAGTIATPPDLAVREWPEVR